MDTKMHKDNSDKRKLSKQHKSWTELDIMKWRTFKNQKKCTTTQNKQKKTKARLSCSHLLWHLAWKRRGPMLVLVLHKSQICHLLT